MADFQRVVEFLRDIRQGPLQSVNDEITQLAADYAALCVQANERLRQCSTFLQQGLRSEAIHLADQSPNLLDLVASLDLPDQNAWLEFCLNNGLTAPPPLQLDRAAQLNEAYAQDQPMEHLLSRHRLLALSRAPVRDRLEVLRKITQVDAANANWEKDIRIFERARLKELPAAFLAAVKTNDHEVIAALQQEITAQTWHDPVPPDLAAAVNDAYARVRRSGVEAELRNLIEPLRDAYAARSLQECQALVQRWKNIMAGGGVAQISPELTDEIRPVIAFVAEQSKREDNIRRFREAGKAFAAMLDRDEADAHLEAGYARLQEFKQPIPEELIQRYAAKRTGRRQSTERTHKLRLSAIAATAAGVIIVTLVLVFLTMRSSAAGGWAAKIRNAVKEHSATGMGNAQRYVDELQKTNPALLGQPQVAAAVGELQTQQAEYSRAAAALDDLLKKAAAARAAASPVVANGSATEPEIVVAASALQSVINDAAAGDLSWVDADNHLAGAMPGVKADLGILKDRISTATHGELDNIAARLDAIPASAATPAAATETHAQLAALSDRLEKVRALPLLDDSIQAKISDLTQKLTQRREGAEASRPVADELQNIRQRAAGPADLKAALEAFVQKFPDDPHTRDFSVALQSIPAAAALESWQQLAKSFRGSLAAGSMAATQKRLDAVNAYLAANPGSPVGGPAAQYADYLHRAIDALNDKGTWQTAFADLIATPVLSELGVMKISDGRQYYVLGNVRRVERKINGETSVSFESLNLKDLTKRITITVDPPQTVSDSATPAPHTQAVAQIVESLKLINEDNWETYGIDLTDQLVHNPQMDLIVKAILLLPAMKTQQAVTGDALDDVYTKSIDELSRQTPDQLPWLDPSKITDGTRNAIKHALDAIPPAAGIKKKLADAHTALFQSLLPDSAGTGVLLKDDRGAWQVYTRIMPVRGEKVWAVIPPASTAPAAGSPAPAATAAAPAANPGSMLLVGTVPADAFVLDDAALRTVPQGTIVYLTNP